MNAVYDRKVRQRFVGAVQENVFVRTHWLTGKDGYRFTAKKDVCVYVPKKVKLERVVVMKTPQKVAGADRREEINVAI